MISELEEVLRQLLMRELPVKNGEINIEFDQPRREWSSRLSRPTLNVFLYDLRENNVLRQPQWEVKRNGNTSSRRRTPMRVDLSYMITAWAAEPDDEHRLLSRTLMALFRNPEIPQPGLPENLRDQPVPIPVVVASHEALQNAADIWGVLDNEIRPAVALSLTLALNPYQEVTGPLVRTRQLRFGQKEPGSRRLVPGSPIPESGIDAIWQVGGTLHAPGTLQAARVLLVERGLEVPVSPDGRYTIGGLEEGDYTLEVTVDGSESQRRSFHVPSSDYDLDLGN